jgi:two-component system invasion response regulator UvrY
MSQLLIVDDHAMTRAGYRQFLRLEPAINGVREAANTSEARELLSQEAFDIVLLDMQLPDARGFDALRLFLSEHPNLKILIVSGLPEAIYARDALRAGACGYLSKGSAPAELLKAVRTVLANRRYISEGFAQVLAADLDGDPNQPLHARLSTREFQVFTKLAAGLTVSKIGELLGLSVKTVSTYRSRLMDKMTLASNANITAYAVRHGLIEPPDIRIDSAMAPGSAE